MLSIDKIKVLAESKDKDISSLAKEHLTLLEKYKSAINLIEELEWSGCDTGGEYTHQNCPDCWAEQWPAGKHNKGCELKKLLNNK